MKTIIPLVYFCHICLISMNPFLRLWDCFSDILLDLTLLFENEGWRHPLMVFRCNHHRIESSMGEFFKPYKSALHMILCKQSVGIKALLTAKISALNANELKIEATDHRTAAQIYLQHCHARAVKRLKICTAVARRKKINNLTFWHKF